MNNIFVLILVYYIWIGICFGLGFIALSIIEDIRGNIDHKFGPAWKSSMTYMLAATMSCPIINLFWVYVYLLPNPRNK